MPKIKIVQITSCGSEDYPYGLSDTGLLYYWGSKPRPLTEQEKADGRTSAHNAGWILLHDTLNTDE